MSTQNALTWMGVLLGVSLACGASSAAEREAWGRFRGPNGTGVSEATGLPVSFGPEKNVLWKTPLPPGHSSPVLSDSRIFLTAHSPGKESYTLLVIGLDRRTGRELWRREVPRGQTGRRENVNGPASPSPVTDGANVYAFFQDFGLISYTADGRERWRKPIGPFNMFYGFGASPMLADGTLVLSVDQDKDSYLLGARYEDRPRALEDAEAARHLRLFDPDDLSSGDGWRAAARARVVPAHRLCALGRQAGVVGARPRLRDEIGGERRPRHALHQRLGLSAESAGTPGGDGALRRGPEALRHERRWPRRADGSERDRADGPDARARRRSRPSISIATACSTPSEWDVFRAMLASENGLLAIKLGGKGDMTDRAIRWRYQRPVPQVPSTLLYQGVLFMVNDSGILLAFDPTTGQVLKEGRLKGAIDKYFASPVGADGKVWLVSQDGTVSVVSARGDWEILSVNPLDDEVFATPVPADGQLFVRTRSALYAFGGGQ